MGAVVAVSEWLWRLECALNRRLPLSRGSEPPADYARQGASLPLLDAGSAVRVPQRDLLVVLTTHGRPEPCARLVEELAREASCGPGYRPLLLVLEDPSDTDYGPVAAALEQGFPGRHAYYRGKRWLGKRGYWRVFQQAFEVVRTVQPQLTLFVQDDLSLRPGFFGELLGLWDEIDDARKAVLYACSMEGDQVDGRWIRYRRRSCARDKLWQTQWFDLQAFLASPTFFELLKYRVFPISNSRWRHDPSRSSGVGEQLSRRLSGRAGIYQVKRTLVFHGGETSLMNPEGRARIRFDNREGAIASTSSTSASTDSRNVPNSSDATTRNST